MERVEDMEEMEEIEEMEERKRWMEDHCRKWIGLKI